MTVTSLTGRAETRTGFVSLVLTAISGGGRVLRLLGSRPPPRIAWPLGLAFSLVAFLVSVPLMLIVFALVPGLAVRLSGLPLIVGILGYVALGSVLSRVGLGFGARLAEKRLGGGRT